MCHSAVDCVSQSCRLCVTHSTEHPSVLQAAKEGEGCPFGFGGKAESASAPNASQKAVLKRNLAEAGEGAPAEPECPWPFIMLHDPVKGHAAHAAKNAKAALGAAALAVAAAVLVQVKTSSPFTACSCHHFLQASSDDAFSILYGGCMVLKTGRGGGRGRGARAGRPPVSAA